MANRTTHARKKRRNAGWFKRGYDERRHTLTKEECQRGYQTAIMLDWHIGTWVWRKVRAHYCKLRRAQRAAEAGQSRSGRPGGDPRDPAGVAGATAERDGYDESAIPY